MRVVCSYCDILFNLKDPIEKDEETHGICPECLPWILHNIEIEIAKTKKSHHSNRSPGAHVRPIHSDLSESGGEELATGQPSD